MNIARTLLVSLTLFTPIVGAGSYQPGSHATSFQDAHAGHASATSSKLIEEVRAATEIYRDINQLTGTDYGAVLGCVSGPDQGAMGVHFVNGPLLVDDTVNPSQPEALIYEFKDGRARLVGVEFIVFTENWHKTHAENDPPVIEGQLMNRVEKPNRFGLPSHYELHVWAWQDNPNGAFVDWNPRVSCEGQ